MQCDIEANEAEVSGGGLDGEYSVLQFHFHWDVVDHSGSEHALDGYHYPMEVKFLNILSSFLMIHLIERLLLTKAFLSFYL